MKKLILLLAAGFTVLSVNAQYSKPTSVVRISEEKQASAYNKILTPYQVQQSAATPSATSSHMPNAKTTNGGDRWYGYTDYLKRFGKAYDSIGNYLWFTGDSYWQFSGGPSINKNVSCAMTCDPFWAGYNDSNAFPGAIATGPLDNYTYDSVEITGAYVLAKTGITDHLLLSFYYGDLSNTSNIFFDGYFDQSVAPALLTDYGLTQSDSLFVFNTRFDSVTGYAKANTGAPAIVTLDYPLHEGDTALSGNGNYKKYRIAVPNGGIAVPMGRNLMGCAITFKSGDASYVAGDTVSASAGFNFNAFLPAEYMRGTRTSPTFPTYVKYTPHQQLVDGNVGFFKTEPDGTWTGSYVPMYAWSSQSGGAAQSQYVGVKFHITCSTCGLTSNVGVNTISKVVSSVNVVPNPASNQVAISFDLNSITNTTVTLTNTLGQVVKTQNMGNVSEGNAVFNVSELANGVYFYSVNANGERSTGRVVVAH